MGGTSPIGNGQDGKGGFGGGIYNSGVMTVTLGQVVDNQTGTGNGGVGRGGGIANEGKMIFSNGTIADNQTSPEGDGGGVHTSGLFTITGSTVISNTAGGLGGGIFTEGGILYGSNDIFACNMAGLGYPGSGLYIQNTTTKLLHTSLAQNTGGKGSGIAVVNATLQMTNTILVSHTIGISVALGAEALVESTLWGDGIWANEIDWTGSGSIITGTHNYWFEPGFVDPFYFDYHISPASAALDRGAHSEIETDIDNQLRPNPATGIADLGADEYWEYIPISQVEISGPMTGTALTTISFTATITPEAATPNILFYWMPPPDNGQWTNMANYLWTRPGMKIIEVTAINAGSRLTETFTISLERGFPRLFLPIVIQ
jgi:hypothetical protein